jgi:hypothetical protein
MKGLPSMYQNLVEERCICALQPAGASLKEIPANMATNAKEYQLE